MNLRFGHDRDDVAIRLEMIEAPRNLRMQGMRSLPLPRHGRHDSRSHGVRRSFRSILSQRASVR
jgi:hypothetical protein